MFKKCFNVIILPKVVPEYKDLAKKKIIKASYSIFDKKGYDSTSMDDIAKEVGVSKASLYSYFKSKEEILQITVDHALTEPFIKIFRSGKSVEAFNEYFNNMTVFEGVLHLNFVLTALAFHKENIRMNLIDSYEKKMRALTDFIEIQQKKGAIRQDMESKDVAQFITAVYNDLAMQLIMGVNENKISRSLKNALSLILEEKISKDQKTLNSYF
jgi:AcrR family transcriptional regulator